MSAKRKRNKPKLTSAQLIQPGAEIYVTCRECGEDYALAFPVVCPNCGTEYRPAPKPKTLGISVSERIETEERLS